MGINNAYPVVDGIAPSWSDIIIRLTPIGGPMIEIRDIKSIKRQRAVTMGEQKGATGGRVVKRTTGEVKHTLDMVMYRDGYNSLIEKLVSLAPARGNQRAISFVHFGIQVQHTPIGSSRIFEWRAKGVRLLGDTHAAQEGVEADGVDVPLSAIDIVDMINGVEVVML